MTTKYVVRSQGTKVFRGDGGNPELFSQIPKLTDMGKVGGSRKLIDVTDLDSSAREYTKGIEDGAEVTLEFIYDDSDPQQEILRLDKAGEDARNFRVVLSTGTRFDFSAHVVGWDVGGPIDDIVKLTVTLKPVSVIAKT